MEYINGIDIKGSNTQSVILSKSFGGLEAFQFSTNMKLVCMGRILFNRL